MEGQRHAEAQCQPDFVERAQRGFRVVDVQGRGAGRVHFVRVGQRAGHPRVQQFVQQQREGHQPFGQQRAARQHVDQAGERAGLFVQQGEVAGAAQDGLQQAEHAAQCSIGLRRASGGVQQRRQHPVQPRAGAVRQRLHAQRLREFAQ